MSQTWLTIICVIVLSHPAHAQQLTPDVPYVKNGHERQVLDIYTPQQPSTDSRPVMFWIHGGGWQHGDKSDVGLKPKVLYDIPKIIMTAEHRQTLYGGKMFTFGHRQKFGNDPEKHVDFSAVTHIKKDRGIPPFLILYFPGNPDTRAQAARLEAVLKESGIPARSYGKSDSNHSRLNNDLGKPDDPATQELYKFLAPLKVP